MKAAHKITQAIFAALLLIGCREAGGKLPAHMPLYPGATEDPNDPLRFENNGYLSQVSQGLISRDSMKKVVEFYRSKAASAGVELKVTPNNLGRFPGFELEHGDANTMPRTLISVHEKPNGPTYILLTYQESLTGD